MLTLANLYILRENLEKVNKTPYFGKHYVTYTSELVNIVSHVIENINKYSEAEVQTFNNEVWRTYKYLSGSVTKEIPYEVEFSIRSALKDWLGGEFAITTALIEDEIGYHFLPVNILSKLQSLIPDYSYTDFNVELIHVALPKFYSEIPIFGIPMYHEIGHFIDHHYGITQRFYLQMIKDSDFLSRHPHLLPFPSFEVDVQREILYRYLKEHFADLFAASYIGYANTEFLRALAGDSPPQFTHPSTSDREKISHDFLEGKSNEIVDLFQKTLKSVSPSELIIRYETPNISTAFNNIRPYAITSSKELHGLYYAAWQYLAHQLDNKEGLWAEGSDEQVIRTVNNLTEKSIRNYSIVEKWDNAIT